MALGPAIDGERILFKTLDPENLSLAYLAWMKDRDVLLYLADPDGDYSPSQLKSFVEAMNRSATDHLFGIFLKSDGRHVGNIKLGGIHPLHKFADIGIIVGDKSIWGQGYATEAIRTLVRYAFDDLRLNKVYAGVLSGNQGSYKAFVKAGFREAVDVLMAEGAPVFKWASPEIYDVPLLRHVAKTKRPVILSTGMCGIGAVEAAVRILEAGGSSEIALLHCISLYPAAPQDANLRMMDNLARVFPCPVGFSDHTMGFAVPLAAVAWGAAILEKHFTLDRKLPGPDHPLNEDCGRYYSPYKDSGMDYLLDEVMRPMKVVSVQTNSLDNLVAKNIIQSPDFISLDVQGAEQLILKGQALIGEISSFLSGYGFDLIDLSLNRRYPVRSRMGGRGIGAVTDGDALFIRRPAMVDQGNFLMQNKLAFVCVLLNHFEGAQQIFDQPCYRSVQGERKYLNFVAEVAAAMGALPKRPFITFAQRYTYEKSLARFTLSGKKHEESFLRKVLKSVGIFLVLVNLRAWGQALLAQCWNLPFMLIEVFLNWWHLALEVPGTVLEKIFLVHGLREQFKVLVTFRIKDEMLYRRTK